MPEANDCTRRGPGEREPSTPHDRPGDAQRLGDLVWRYPVRRVDLTPALARAWLARGTLSGWPRDPQRVETYARQLRADLWRPGPNDLIVMTDDGRLVHCGLWIAAIAEAERTLPVWVLELPIPVAESLLRTGSRGKPGQPHGA